MPSSSQCWPAGSATTCGVGACVRVVLIVCGAQSLDPSSKLVKFNVLRPRERVAARLSGLLHILAKLARGGTCSCAPRHAPSTVGTLELYQVAGNRQTRLLQQPQPRRRGHNPGVPLHAQVAAVHAAALRCIGHQRRAAAPLLHVQHAALARRHLAAQRDACMRVDDGQGGGRASSAAGARITASLL